MGIGQEREMSLIGHLTELRTRLIISLSAVVLCIIVAFFFAKPVLGFLTHPVQALKQEPGRDAELTLLVGPDGSLKLKDAQNTRLNLEHLSQKRFRLLWPADPSHNKLADELIVGESATQKFYYNNPIDPIMMQFKLAFVLGLLLALPILLWQTWLFLKPGLTDKEQSIIKPLLGGALILFPLGAGFAYFIIRFVLKIMQIYAVQNVAPLLNIFDYLSLLSTLMLVFGIIFEVPLVLAIAARIGLVKPKFLQTYRRHAYVLLAIGAAIITPGGDPLTTMIIILPLVLLYELAIVLAIPMARLHQRDQEAQAGNDSEETVVQSISNE